MSNDKLDHYGWEERGLPPSYKYISTAIFSILDEIRPKRVLDIGSGNGVLCNEMTRYGYDVAGIEYDKGGVEISRKRYPNSKFYCFGVQDDPQLLLKDEERFDMVVSTEVIEHLYAPHLLPQYAHSVLREGGTLVVTTPYHGYLKNLALSLTDKWDSHHTALWHGGHIKFWSKRTLTSLLQDNGFSVESFEGVGRDPYLWKSMVLVSRRLSGLS